MTVNELMDSLMSKVVDGELTGNEQVVDSGLFLLSNVELEPTHDDSNYVVLASRELEAAQES